VTDHRVARLSPLEEALLLWHEVNGGWRFELGVSAPTLDPQRLEAAFDSALAHHQLARCAVHADERGGFHWVHDPDATIGPIEVVECADDAARQRVVLAQIATPMALDEAPLVRAVIARCGDRDVLSAGFSHVLADGLGGFRFLRSVARAYRGEPDPAPVVDIAAAHAALASAPSSNWSGLAQKWTTRLDLAATAVTARSPLASSGGRVGAGAGATTRSVPMAALGAAAHRHAGSFGAHAMAALHVTIQRWNRAHNAVCDHVGVSQAVNLRPADWHDDVVASMAAITSVLSRPVDRVDVETAMARLGPQLTAEVQRARAREFVAASAAGRLVPYALRRRALAAVPREQFDTCMLSNFGAVADPPSFTDDSHHAISVTTAAMPLLPVGIAIYTAFAQVHLMVMYRGEYFDENGVNAFVDEYVEALSRG
jgi:NRPS condensation-like uncharacterized protein